MDEGWDLFLQVVANEHVEDGTEKQEGDVPSGSNGETQAGSKGEELDENRRSG